MTCRQHLLSGVAAIPAGRLPLMPRPDSWHRAHLWKGAMAAFGAGRQRLSDAHGGPGVAGQHRGHLQAVEYLQKECQEIEQGWGAREPSGTGRPTASPSLRAPGNGQCERCLHRTTRGMDDAGGRDFLSFSTCLRVRTNVVAASFRQRGGRG
jgi:hypothetical protein